MEAFLFFFVLGFDFHVPSRRFQELTQSVDTQRVRKDSSLVRYGGKEAKQTAASQEGEKVVVKTAVGGGEQRDKERRRPAAGGGGDGNGH